MPCVYRSTAGVIFHPARCLPKLSQRRAGFVQAAGAAGKATLSGGRKRFLKWRAETTTFPAPARLLQVASNVHHDDPFNVGRSISQLVQAENPSAGFCGSGPFGLQKPAPASREAKQRKETG